MDRQGTVRLAGLLAREASGGGRARRYPQGTVPSRRNPKYWSARLVLVGCAGDVKNGGGASSSVPWSALVLPVPLSH
jgi:hypothetical protein